MEEDNKVIPINFTLQRVIREFEDLKIMLQNNIPETEIDIKFKMILDKIHFLKRLGVVGSKRLYWKLKVLKKFVDWSIQTNKPLDRPKMLIEMIEKRIIQIRNDVVSKQKQPAQLSLEKI